MPRRQFSMRTLLWLTVVVAAFFGGSAWQQRRDRPSIQGFGSTDGTHVERLTMPDGTTCFRIVRMPTGKLTFSGDHGESITVDPPPAQPSQLPESAP